MIFIIDFGSQTAHLIARRVKELGIEVQIINPEEAFYVAQNDKRIKGIILSGGPSGVYEKNAPVINPLIFELGIPILGICYGFQLMSKLMGGKVIPGKKEYGPTEIKLKIKNEKLKISEGLPKTFTVWMSHGDEVVLLPKNFEIVGSTNHVKYAFVGDLKRKIFGVQFHPEVEHTEFGTTILENFIKLCNPKCKKQKIDVEKIMSSIKNTVKGDYVIGAVSGGVDSTVAATLAAQAIGKRFIPVYVNNGLMREGTEKQVKQIFSKTEVKPLVVNVKREMLKKLKGVIDPEKKRKIIGKFYIDVFEREMEKLLKQNKDVHFLLQGTIYSDVIESKGTKHAAKIKSHHNVGGLPKKMKLKLLEPLRKFYKDEVREIGRQLNLSDEFINKQPFPGPGFAIRIRGEVTKERLEKEKKADQIILEELKKAKILSSVFMSFPVLTNAFSTAVKGDDRFFGEVVALRVVESKDIMTSKWTKLPYEVLQKISSRIVNEIPGISRVVYDISTKPPATMEWE